MMNIVTYSICTLHYYKVSITLRDKVAASLPNISIITLRLLVSSFSLFFLRTDHARTIFPCYSKSKWSLNAVCSHRQPERLSPRAESDSR